MICGVPNSFYFLVLKQFVVENEQQIFKFMLLNWMGCAIEG